MNPFYRALQTRNVFACHCTQTIDGIVVGWLFVGDPALWGEIITLVQADNPSGQTFTVNLPNRPVPNPTLKFHEPHSTPNC